MKKLFVLTLSILLTMISQSMPAHGTEVVVFEDLEAGGGDFGEIHPEPLPIPLEKGNPREGVESCPDGFDCEYKVQPTRATKGHRGPIWHPYYGKPIYHVGFDLIVYVRDSDGNIVRVIVYSFHFGNFNNGINTFIYPCPLNVVPFGPDYDVSWEKIQAILEWLDLVGWTDPYLRGRFCPLALFGSNCGHMFRLLLETLGIWDEFWEDFKNESFPYFMLPPGTVYIYELGNPPRISPLRPRVTPTPTPSSSTPGA